MKERHELLDSILLSRVGLAGDNDHTGFQNALCKLSSRVGTQKRRCPGAQFAKCEGPVGKNGARFPGRARGREKQHEKWIIFVFDFEEKCGREQAREKEKSGEREWITVSRGTEESGHEDWVT